MVRKKNVSHGFLTVTEASVAPSMDTTYVMVLLGARDRAAMMG